MSKIIPFTALNPKADLASKMICPPYDVINSENARKFAEGNPYSFLHVTKPEIDLDPGINEYDDAVYQKGRENLQQFEKKGYLIRNAPSFYVYRSVMGAHTQTGIVAGVSQPIFSTISSITSLPAPNEL